MYKKFSFLFWLFGVTLAAAQTGGPASALSEQDFLGEMPILLPVPRWAQRLDETPGAMTILDRNFKRMTGGRSDEVERIEVLRGANSAAYVARVTVNEHVARSLGLKLDGAALADRLHRLETLP